MKKRILSLLLAVSLVLAVMPTALAQSGNPTVYLTLSDAGSLVSGKDGTLLARVPIEVSDADEDGHYTIDDALYSLHEQYYDGGAVEGYASVTGSYGQSIFMLWGDVSFDFGYYLNDAVVTTDLHEQISDGDSLTAFIYQDIGVYDPETGAYSGKYSPNGYSDLYTYFLRTDYDATAGNSFTMTLLSSSWTGKGSAAQDVLLSTTDGAALGRTDEKGKLRVRFDDEGVYTVVSVSETDGVIVVPTVCTVHVAAREDDGDSSPSVVPPVDPTPEPQPSVPSFSDVPAGAWYESAAVWAAQNALMTGFPDGTFAPDQSMSRAMAATILQRLCGAATTAGSADFSDVPAGAWYESAVAWASGKGIVTGMGDGRFAPNAPISRAQLCVMLYRAAGVLGLDTAARGDLSAFSDAAQVPDYAKEAMAWCVSSGILSGTALKSAAQASRAEIAVMLQRFPTK
ncbi:MAG: S-layer homology domain-containing protein [Oscillospiraceae bacterium]|nr:S-layer homology domain-containing protein [Oscillospiraceae bacterium]